MKKNSRNQRFIEEIDRLISENVFKHITNAADRLGTYPTVLSDIRKNIRAVPKSLIYELSKFGVSPNYLFDFDEDENFLNIQFMPKKIAAGSEQVNELELIKTPDIQRFRLPNLKIEGELFAFEVDGDSMLPDFFRGQLVICRRLEKVDEVKDGIVYVILLHNIFLVKRLKKDIKNKCLIGLHLIADNPDYPDDYIDSSFFEGIRGNIFRVLNKITIEDI